jgi:hypothetical protein
VAAQIINLSLQHGTVPDSLKEAIIRPLLKKPSLNPDAMNNYRPVSNLSHLSKLLERVVSQRVQEHFSANNICNHFQSAHKSFHSTETALLRVQNDILMSVDKNGGAILMLLDLSAAFKTIDHRSTTRASQVYMYSTAVVRILLGCKETVHPSAERYLPAGHAQTWCPTGSVIGPLLFTMYMQPLSQITSQHQLDHHIL